MAWPANRGEPGVKRLRESTAGGPPLRSENPGSPAFGLSRRFHSAGGKPGCNMRSRRRQARIRDASTAPALALRRIRLPAVGPVQPEASAPRDVRADSGCIPRRLSGGARRQRRRRNRSASHPSCQAAFEATAKSRLSLHGSARSRIDRREAQTARVGDRSLLQPQEAGISGPEKCPPCTHEGARRFGQASLAADVSSRR